jgi:putative intracellular protease/amidase
VRGKAERFADHYTQAKLFWNSQSPVEKAHNIGAFRFELTRVQTVAVRERMVSSLVNVAPELASAVAQGLGMREVPAAMPKASGQRVGPEIAASPALSLFARPGDGSIATRRIAVLVADKVAGKQLIAIHEALGDAGAVPRFVGVRLGAVATSDSDAIEVEVTFETMPSVLFDAVVLPDGAAAIEALAQDGHAIEFLRDQYRHCKTILALGAGEDLLEKAGLRPGDGGVLRSGSEDDGHALKTSWLRSRSTGILSAMLIRRSSKLRCRRAMPERQQPRSISYSSSRPEILTVKGTAKKTWFDLQTDRPKLVPGQVILDGTRVDPCAAFEIGATLAMPCCHRARLFRRVTPATG